VIVNSGAQTIEFADGSAGAPSITNSGDTNTGIFFSAADTIDFAEGGTACGQFDSSANFKFNSGYGSVETAYGCRAWVNFNGTGTPAIRASGNVSSLADIGIGDYRVNLTNSMPDDNYACVALIGNSGGAGVPCPNGGPNGVGQFYIYTYNNSGSTFDYTQVQVAILR
jgi:hypothetical protein